MAIPFFDAIDVQSALTTVQTLQTSDGIVSLVMNNGTPNNVITANRGSLCFDRQGKIWKKETGDGTDTGWVELTAGGGGPISAIYSEVPNKNARPAFEFDGQLVKCDTNRVTYIEYQGAWQIFAMHSSGPNSAFDGLNATPDELEEGQQFTSLQNHVTVVWKGVGTGWIDEGP